MLKRWIKLIVLCFTVVFMHGAALAAVAVHNSFPVKVAVYTNTPAINFQQNLSILIAFDIADPWHILSSDANNIGLPTKIVWKLPEGYKISDEKWSQEQEFPSEFGPQYGFSGTAFYQAEIIPEGNQRLKADFSVDISWQACSEECLQQESSFDFSLPISAENVLPSAEWAGIQAFSKPYFEKVPQSQAMTSEADISFWGILLMAFVGGLILNLMPCVLPILSLKIVSLLPSSTDFKKARLDALAYFAGVMVSFVLMALILFVLRKSGEAIGWGYQLQSPWFVGFLLIIFLVLTFMFLDFVSFDFVFSNKANRLSSQKGWKGSFFTGIFSVLVASSCSAPFMGAAIGYTLMQPLSVCLLVFMVLGFGYALPFTLAGFFPAFLSRILPRPGKWMLTFKKILAIPMALTCLWLGWVLYAQLSFSSLHNQDWKAYDESEIASLVAAGDNVLIDFSAKWCLTCLANEKMVLDTDKFVSYAKKNGIKLYRADWTHKNPEITQALVSFGRNSVPLYVFYQQGKPNILPQLFTFNQLIDLLKQK